MEDRPRSIPELRGMERDYRPPGEKPYSARSYAAQYGVPLDLAERVVSSCQTHGSAKHAIQSAILKDPDLKDRALLKGEYSIFPNDYREISDLEERLISGEIDPRQYFGEFR